MDNYLLFPRQSSSDGCVVCPAPPPCTPCQANEECIRINRDCTKCGETKCVPIGGSVPTSDGGVSRGALAGGIVGTILFFVLALALFLGYRKKILLLRATRTRRDVKKDTPASAEMVLNRPDPTEKTAELAAKQAQRTSSPATMALSHETGPLSRMANPFDDVNSIQTAGTEGTNVIPIALVAPDSIVTSFGQEASSSPLRPVRTPEVNLNLEHLNVSHDNVRAGAGSTRSGMSRNSYMSSASYASEFLKEAPMIVTPTTQGAVRQVLGVVKAEVINTAVSTSDTLRPPTYRKPVATSPLASTSFGMNQTLEGDHNDESSDPFVDGNLPTQTNFGVSPAPSSRTVGYIPRESARSTLAAETLDIPDRNRPSSVCTQAGSVVDIASATRVNLGLKFPGTAASFRTTKGRLISSPTRVGELQEQQKHAFAQGRVPVDARRISASSAVSSASTRADSILESFPFVPPSPISDRPVRSPPVSPLATQSFTTSVSSINQQALLVPASPMPQQSNNILVSKSHFIHDSDPLPSPPNRRTLGLSTGSNLSNASSGLGSFPFQIETETTNIDAQHDRKRASLDTLVLTNDLSSHPLSFNHADVKTTPK